MCNSYFLIKSQKQFNHEIIVCCCILLFDVLICLYIEQRHYCDFLLAQFITFSYSDNRIWRKQVGIFASMNSMGEIQLYCFYLFIFLLDQLYIFGRRCSAVIYIYIFSIILFQVWKEIENYFFVKGDPAGQIKLRI